MWQDLVWHSRIPAPANLTFSWDSQFLNLGCWNLFTQMVPQSWAKPVQCRRILNWPVFRMMAMHWDGGLDGFFPKTPPYSGGGSGHSVTSLDKLPWHWIEAGFALRKSLGRSRSLFTEESAVGVGGLPGLGTSTPAFIMRVSGQQITSMRRQAAFQG